MREQVCKIRRRCAPPFSRYLRKTWGGGGVKPPPPRPGAGYRDMFRESCRGNSKNKFRRELNRILEKFFDRIIGSFRESFGKSNADQPAVLSDQQHCLLGVKATWWIFFAIPCNFFIRRILSNTRGWKLKYETLRSRTQLIQFASVQVSLSHVIECSETISFVETSLRVKLWNSTWRWNRPRRHNTTA